MKKIYHKPFAKMGNSDKNNSEKNHMRVSNEMLLREIAGEYILIPIGQTALRVHGMIRLSESGLLLWKKLQNGTTEEEMVNSILEEYIIDRETAIKEVRAFIGQMRRIGILIETCEETRE